jgi:exportin-1
MEALLDESQPLSVPLLDQVVDMMYSPGVAGPADREAAQKTLEAFQQLPSAWQKVDQILQESQSATAKFIALQILEPVVKFQWKSLPREQCDGIKDFIVNLLIRMAGDIDARAAAAAAGQDGSGISPHSDQEIGLLVKKLNVVLANIVKQEWPRNWENFIAELVGASRTSETLCANNMHLLQLMSEEVFDFGLGELTQAKMTELKSSFNREFGLIFELCQGVLDTSQNLDLLEATLETLLRFLNWIPLGFIFETNMVDSLTTRFLPHPQTRNVTLACLTEIVSLQVGNLQDAHFQRLFLQTLEQLRLMVPIDSDLASAFLNGTDEEQVFIQDLALFLTSAFKAHRGILEQEPCDVALLDGHAYLCQISLVDDVEVFKICLEYWNVLASELYRDSNSAGFGAGGFLGVKTGGLLVGDAAAAASGSAARRQFYASTLTRVRLALIQRMPRPEDVLIVENDVGEIVREYMKDTDAITLFKTMRATLIFLTHLDPDDTQNIMLVKLAKQVSGEEWSWNNLNTLCWAIGAISGAQTEYYEKRFLVTVIKDLLGLCEHKRGKDNKAVIASNIMYIVGRYPRFLRAHWKFLKTVVNKLFEFMHERHPGVQDMAVDTFLKISQKCRRKFVVLQPEEEQPFVEEIVINLPNTIRDLEPQQIHVFYEAVGFMVQSEPDQARRDNLLAKLLEIPNANWVEVTEAAGAAPDFLQRTEACFSLTNVLKTHVAVCRAMGHGYVSQFSPLFLQMLSVYQTYSGIINGAVATQGEYATQMANVRSMRAVKKECLRLTETYIMRTEDPAWVAEYVIPPLLEAVLGDYHQSVPGARDAEVLSVMAAIINKLQDFVTKDVPRIFEHVFECTLEMITKNFQDYPDARVQFFVLLQAINANCFAAFFQMSPELFKLVVDSVVWAFKHMERTVSETGLTIMQELLHNVTTGGPDITNAFFSQYGLMVVQDVFAVLTDTYHKSGFGTQTAILLHVFGAIEDGLVTNPLWDENVLAQLESNRQALAESRAAAGVEAVAVVPLDPNQLDNMTFIREYSISLIEGGFPNMTSASVRVFVEGLFTLSKDLPAFRSHLRDFLIQTKEFASDDNADLYLEEKRVELAQAQQERDTMEQQVPGMIPQHAGTHELMDDDEIPG